MPWHLPDEKLMDVMEGVATPGEREHAASCVVCRARVEEARKGLEHAGEAGLPEPSPLYWEALRRQVGRRLVAEGRASWWWRLGPALAAAAALVVLVPALKTPEPTPVGASGLLSAWSALPASEDDPGLSVLAGVASGGVDLAAVRQSARLAEDLAELSEEDSQALAEALRLRLQERL